VLYAIDVLESLDKRNLVTPLLLHHESPAVRERALRALGAAQTPQAAELAAADPAAALRRRAGGAGGGDPGHRRHR
jgi:hypothetical protein